MSEAARQSALLAALHGGPERAALQLREQGARRARGLAAYRANAAALAERALAASYPTVQSLVGTDDFAALARALWRAAPPARGDLAQWGGELPAFIAAEGEFDPWPYLADCARLDAAIQRCESAADAVLDRDSLALLAERPPEALRLHLQPCVQLLASAWPVASILVAHRCADEATEAAFAAARTAVEERRPEAVAVARAGWRAEAVIVSAADHAWMQALKTGADLAAASAAAGPGFDLSDWLLRALRHGWLWKAEPLASPRQGEFS